MVPASRTGRSLLILFSFLVLVGSTKAEEAFWVAREEPLKDNSWRVYVPSNESLSKQAVLIYAELPTGDTPVVPRQVLSQLYHHVKGLKVMGRKKVAWRDGEGTLVSFSGQVDKKEKVVGRAVVASTQNGTEVLLLVRHPRSDDRIVESYELIRRGIDSFLSTKQKSESEAQD